ncbi:MAG TPA: response regulator transcription factor [Xanthobacteraceae bacterium]|nr:response regulator transcription factor [Xanthobacteraceae bacterium]
MKGTWETSASGILVVREERGSLMEGAYAAIRVIVVEDDIDFCESLAEYLRIAGMTVRAAHTIAGLERTLAEEAADIIVLDVNLPGETGFSAINRLKLASRARVVMLTGRSALHDRLHGLSLGADHYLVKPFDMTELKLVIRNLHARLGTVELGQRDASTGWTLDTARWVLRSPNGDEVSLSKHERCLMARLMDEPGCPVSREDLNAALKKTDCGQTTRAAHLEVLIFRLRRKAVKICGHEFPIRSVRGFGYAFNGEAQ